MTTKTGVPNLYVTKAKGKKYYRYKHPQKGTFHGMGSDLRKAKKAAMHLNAELDHDLDLVARVLNEATLVESHIQWFKENFLPQSGFQPNTLDMYKTQLRSIQRQFGQRPMNALTVKELAEFGDTMSVATYRHYKQVLVKLCATAVSRGVMDDNVAQKLMNRKAKRERSRLRWEVFLWAQEHAEPWLRNLMRMALISLQRRSDLVEMKVSDIKDGYLHVVQQKTQKYDSAHLRIRISQDMQEVIDQAIHPRSPYIFHRVPKRKKSPRHEKKHWSYIEPRMVSKEFHKLILKCPLLTKAELENPPTFHEIRALGIKLYRDRGMDPQQLAGHTNSLMTDHYDAGHDNKRWIEVNSGLGLKF